MSSFRLVRPGLAAFVFLASCLSAAAASRTIEGVPRFGHVFMIVGENTTYDHLTPTNAPCCSCSRMDSTCPIIWATPAP